MARSSKKRPTSSTKSSRYKPPAVPSQEIPAVRPVAERAKPAITPQEEPALVTTLKKKELIERVVSKSDMKRKDVKPVVEAMLAVLREALASGEDLNLPPMGKVKIKRSKDKDDAKILFCNIRLAGKPALVADASTVDAPLIKAVD